MTGCSIPGCTNSTENGWPMKILPRSNVPREKWIKSISRPNWLPDEHTYCVCEEHYEPDKTVTLCFDGKQDPESFDVPTIQPLQKSKAITNGQVQSNASKTYHQLRNVRIKNLKNDEMLLSDNDSLEFEVIEEIEYEVMEESVDNCDQKPDEDSEKMMITEKVEENSENSCDQHSDKDLDKVNQIQEIKEESMNDCKPSFNEGREKVSNVWNKSSKHLKSVIDGTEKLHKNQENLTPNTDDSFLSKKNLSQSQENFSESSQSLNCKKEKLHDDSTLLVVKKENPSLTYKTSIKNKPKLSKNHESDPNIIKLPNDQIVLIKKEIKIAPKQDNSINSDTKKLHQNYESLNESKKKFHPSQINLIHNSNVKLHQGHDNPIKSIKILINEEEKIKFNQEKEKCERKVDEKQENSNKNQQTSRIIENSAANLQNKLFLIVKPEKQPQNQETLPQNHDRLDKKKTVCNVSNDKLLKNPLILIKNQNNVQKAPENAKPNGTTSVKNQVILIQNPNKVPEAQENVAQTGVNLVKNQLFLILKQDSSPHTEQNPIKTGQEKPQIQNHSVQSQEKLHIDEGKPNSNKRKLRSDTKSESENNKKLCTSQDNEKLPPCSEKLIENRRKLSQYLQYLNEASKTVKEYKKNKIIEKDTKELSSQEIIKNVVTTQKEKKNEIDDDPFSTNDPEQFSIVNEPVSISTPTCNNNNNNDNINNNNSCSSSNNNDNDVSNKNSSTDKDKINYMNKLIEKQQQLLRVYRNKLGFARYKIKDQEAKLELWRSMMETIFNDDQISYLEALQSQKKRCKCWSTATIKDALEIKNIIGTTGYEELLRRKYPFPALRTLREKTQKPKADE